MLRPGKYGGAKVGTKNRKIQVAGDCQNTSYVIIIILAKTCNINWKIPISGSKWVNPILSTELQRTATRRMLKKKTRSVTLFSFYSDISILFSIEKKVLSKESDGMDI